VEILRAILRQLAKIPPPTARKMGKQQQREMLKTYSSGEKNLQLNVLLCYYVDIIQNWIIAVNVSYVL